MRLRGQTAKIKRGFVLFPNHAPWLEAYLRELLSFPNSKYDDQVDSTVFALAWVTPHPPYRGWTDESLNNFAKFVDGMAMDNYFDLSRGAPGDHINMLMPTIRQKKGSQDTACSRALVAAA